MKTILRDEIITILRKQVMATKLISLNEDLSQDKTYGEIDSEAVIRLATDAANTIKLRLQELMLFNQNEDTKIYQLVSKSRNLDYLCRMDPSYQPWL